MLSSPNRLRDGDHFALAVRRGRRAGGRLMVVHLASADLQNPQVGFVVSKAVGGAVTRNQVKRRLRHIARSAVSSLEAGSVLVVRALPASATASSTELSDEFSSLIRRVAA